MRPCLWDRLVQTGGRAVRVGITLPQKDPGPVGGLTRQLFTGVIHLLPQERHGIGGPRKGSVCP